MDLKHRLWHKLDIADAVAALSVDPSLGLGEDDINRRRALTGFNTLPETSRRSSLKGSIKAILPESHS